MKRLGILPTMLSLRRFSCTVRIEKTISIVRSIPETHIGAPLNVPIRIPLSAAHANPHAKDAIRQIRLYKPDIVLMDIDMPVTNGLEGLRNIRAEKMEVTIIMLTVFDDNDRIFQSICYGASGYILKKTAPDKMISFIQEAQEGGAPMTHSVARQVLKLFSQPFQFNIELQKLTPRENDVLSLLVRGYSYKMAAWEINISI